MNSLFGCDLTDLFIKSHRDCQRHENGPKPTEEHSYGSPGNEER
jgi:hypothetical protein